MNRKKLLMTMLLVSMTVSACGMTQRTEDEPAQESVEETLSDKIDKKFEEISHVMSDLQDDSCREIYGDPFSEDQLIVSARVARTVFKAGESSAVEVELNIESYDNILILGNDDDFSGKLILTNDETGEEICQELERNAYALFATYTVDIPGSYTAQIQVDAGKSEIGFSDPFPVKVIDPLSAEGQSDIAKTREQWREVYIDFLEELEKEADLAQDHTNRYDMALIDNDSIPELLVSTGNANQEDKVTIYSYESGKVWKVGEFGSYGNVEYVARKGTIIDTGVSNGAMTYTFYDMFRESADKKSQLSFIPEGDTITYYIDGQQTDKDTYKTTFCDLVGSENEVSVRGTSTGYELTDEDSAIEEFVDEYPWYTDEDMTAR